MKIYTKSFLIKVIWVVVLLIGLLLRLRLAWDHSLWLDESFTIQIGKQIGNYDLFFQKGNYWDYSHPSFFYILAKAVVDFNQSELAIRLIFVIPYLVTYVFLSKILKFSGQGKYSLLALLLFSIHPTLVNMGYQLRMYPWVIMSEVLAIYYLYVFDNNRKLWTWIQALFWLTISYYFDYSVIWLYLSVFIAVIYKSQGKLSSKIKPFVLMGVSTLICILPQVLVMINNFDKAVELQKNSFNFNLKSVVSTIGFFSGTGYVDNWFPRIWLSNMVLLMAIYLNYQKFENSKKNFLWVIFLSFTLVPLISVLYSYIFTPIYQPRNLVILTLVVIVGISHILDKKVRQIIPNYMAVLLLSIILIIFSFDSVSLSKTKDSLDWRKISDEIKSGSLPIYIGNFDYEFMPLTIYYLANEDIDILRLDGIANLSNINYSKKDVVLLLGTMNSREYVDKEVVLASRLCQENKCHIYYP